MPNKNLAKSNANLGALRSFTKVKRTEMTICVQRKCSTILSSLKQSIKHPEEPKLSCGPALHCSTEVSARGAAIEVSFVTNLPQQILQDYFNPVPESARKKLPNSAECSENPSSGRVLGSSVLITHPDYILMSHPQLRHAYVLIKFT